MDIQATPADEALPEGTGDSAIGARERGIAPIGSVSDSTIHTIEFRDISSSTVSRDQARLSLSHLI